MYVHIKNISGTTEPMKSLVLVLGWFKTILQCGSKWQTFLI